MSAIPRCSRVWKTRRREQGPGARCAGWGAHPPSGAVFRALAENRCGTNAREVSRTPVVVVSCRTKTAEKGREGRRAADTGWSARRRRSGTGLGNNRCESSCRPHRGRRFPAKQYRYPPSLSEPGLALATRGRTPAGFPVNSRGWSEGRATPPDPAVALMNPGGVLPPQGRHEFAGMGPPRRVAALRLRYPGVRSCLAHPRLFTDNPSGRQRQL